MGAKLVGCPKPRVRLQHTIHSTFHGHSRRVKRIPRRLITILNYTAVIVSPRTTSLMSQPRTSHNSPRCLRGHPRNPLICKDRVMEFPLYPSITIHSEARLSHRTNNLAHIGPPRFLSPSNIILGHHSPAEYLFNPHTSPPTNPPMSLRIPRRYLHLFLPNLPNTRLRPPQRRTLPTGLHMGPIMIIGRRAIRLRTRRLRRCPWARHTLLHMTTSVPMRLEGDPAAHQATATHPNQSQWSMMCKT